MTNAGPFRQHELTDEIVLLEFAVREHLMRLENSVVHVKELRSALAVENRTHCSVPAVARALAGLGWPRVRFVETAVRVDERTGRAKRHSQHWHAPAGSLLHELTGKELCEALSDAMNGLFEDRGSGQFDHGGSGQSEDRGFGLPNSPESIRDPLPPTFRRLAGRDLVDVLIEGGHLSAWNGRGANVLVVLERLVRDGFACELDDLREALEVLWNWPGVLRAGVVRGRSDGAAVHSRYWHAPASSRLHELTGPDLWDAVESVRQEDGESARRRARKSRGLALFEGSNLAEERSRVFLRLAVRDRVRSRRAVHVGDVRGSMADEDDCPFKTPDLKRALRSLGWIRVGNIVSAVRMNETETKMRRQSRMWHAPVESDLHALSGVELHDAIEMIRMPGARNAFGSTRMPAASEKSATLARSLGDVKTAIHARRRTGETA